MSETERPSPPPMPELPWVLETLLFVSDEPVPLSQLARAAGVGEGAARRALLQLRADYEARGLRLQEDGGQYQLVTAPQYAGYVAQRNRCRDSAVLSGCGAPRARRTGATSREGCSAPGSRRTKGGASVRRQLRLHSARPLNWLVYSW